MRAVAVLACLLIAAPALAEPDVPAAFLGEWRAELKDCGSTTDDSRLFIEPGQVWFWESSGPVLSVEVHSPREATLVVRLEGEGEAWDDRLRYRLSDDGRSLADISGGEVEPFVRRRCPAR